MKTEIINTHVYLIIVIIVILYRQTENMCTNIYKVSVRASVCKICSSIDWERLAGRITEGIAMVVRRWESIPCIIRYAPKTTHDPESPGATIWSKPLTNGRNSGPPASSLPIWADKDTMRDHLFHQRIYSFSSAANANATRWNHAIGVGAVHSVSKVEKTVFSCRIRHFLA